MVFGQAVEGPLRCSLAESCLSANRRPGRASVAQRGNLASIHGYTRPAEFDTLCAGCFQACPYTLRNADALLLGDRGNDGDYRVLEDPAGIEILLGEAPVADSVGREPVKMLEGFEHTLVGKPSSAQNNSTSNLRVLASLNIAWNSPRSSVLAVSWSMYSR